MARISHIAVVALMVTLSSSSVVKAPSNGTFELLILHNNDMHARFEQTSQLSGTCTTEDRDAGKCYGGFPRVATLVKEARAAAASGQGPPVLYLNAGDTYTGTAWFTIYKWKVAAEFLNAIQPDAVSPGNNDFENGTKMTPLLENLESNILASNIIVNDPANKQIIKKSIVKTIGDVKIGLIGYLSPDTTAKNTADNIIYEDEVSSIKEEVEKLKSLGVKIIIALGNSEQMKDIQIATEVDGIDLVIAGHKNLYLWNGANAESRSDIKDQIIVTQKSGKRVPIIKSYAYNENLGQVALKFNSDGEITDYKITKIPLDTSIPQDTETFKIVNKLRSDILASSDAVIGKTAVVLDGESCKLEECNLGNLIADSVMYYYAVRHQGERWTDAPIAVIHGGAISSSIAPTNRPAGVTTNNLLAAIPSQNNVVSVTMNGTILLQMLEHSVADYRLNNPSGQFLQLSGIRVTYDLAKDRGSRIVNVMARCWDCSIPEFFSIDDWREYKVLMPAALANGQLGYTMLEGLPRQNQDFNEATCTAEFIRLRSPVYPEVAGRVVLLNTESAPGSAPKLQIPTFLFALIIMFSIW